MTPEEMDALAAKFGGKKANQDLSAVAAQFGGKAEEKGLFARIGDDFTKRSQISDQITQAMQSGQQGPSESGFQQLGKVYAGGVNDVLGELIKSGINYTPEAIKQPIGSALSALADTQVGRAVTGAGQSALAEYEGFAQEHPRAARNLEAAGNIIPLVTPVKGKTIAGAGLEAVEGTGKTLAKVAEKAIPQVDEGLAQTARLARKYEIPLSFDQISDSRALKNAQKVSQELPFSGQAGFRDKQMSAFNKALLKTVGQDGEKLTPEAMNKAFKSVGKEFDALGAGKTFQLDDKFARSLDTIRSDAKSIASKDAIENFENEAANIFKEAGNTGSISGEKLGKLRSRINGLARKTNNLDTQELLHDLENSLIDVITENDVKAKKALTTAKQRYKNLIVLEPLVAKSKGGNISPSLLNNRVSRIYGRSHSIGEAGEIGDLARIGHELLPELGGSDTAQKTLAAAGVLGTIANPTSAIPIAGGLAANRAAQGINRNQKLIDKALKKAKK